MSGAGEAGDDHSSAMAELLAQYGFRRFMMSRSGVGHLVFAGKLGDRSIDIVLDTGAGRTFIELTHCRAEGIAVSDTGVAGAPAARATTSAASNVFKVDEDALTLDGMAIRYDGLFALDMSFTNEKLALRGIEPIRAVIGQDVLRNHKAVIDHAALALFLKAD